ncbi:Inner membrane protein yccS [Achromobacter xylosoxidans]|uniref:FUSC family protein n=3 Tax=Alcaligenes xylosoxydans xylosoxydans TaxID=85698 RepID=UPI0006C0E332|nr:FUSC family protein [Achromobacter xylosoxidans]CUI37514.1 Inner membrane protein yccS [Achromobacter xylosoxidans]
MPDTPAAPHARTSNMRWLMSLAHMEPSPVSRWVALRAALAIGLPTAAGLALDQSAAAALVALGALPAITGDNGGPYRNRALSIGSTVFGGALGYLLGSLLSGHGLLSAAAMTLLVLAASLVGTFNNIAAVATLQFATYVIVGASLTSPLPPWLPPALVGAGGLFGLALTLLGWVVNPIAPERAAVALAYRKLAAMFAAIGTSRIMTARRDMEAAMAGAYDTVLAARRRAAGPSPRLARLAAQLQACTPLSDAALALARAGRVLPPECSRAMNRLADHVENATPPAPGDDIAAVRQAGATALADALEQARPLLEGSGPARPDAFPALPPARPRTPWRVLARTYRPGPTTLRYLVRLGLCLVVAEAVARTLALPRSYWVPLIVVVVFKPNFGSVFARALQSCAGSVVGVAISATVLALDRSGVVSLLAVTGLAALLPWSIRRNYGLFSAILLPILMLLIGALQPGSWPIALARLEDVAVAAAIVLAVGYLPWMRLERHNLDQAVATAIDTLAAYLNAVFQADSTARHELRTQAYARLSDLRIALQRGLSEPRLVSRRALAWWPVEVALERVANAVSDSAWALPADQPPPAPAAVARLADILHAMAQAVTRGVAVGPAPVATDEPALREAAGAIEALRATLAGPGFATEPGRPRPPSPRTQPD